MTLIITPSITSWTRLEPRPRTADFVSTLRAELRDPLWLLTRQRRVGEFKMEDTGSPAYTRITKQHADIKKWGYQDGAGSLVELDFQTGRPLEAQALAEPHTADLATRIELGQILFDLVDAKVTGDPAAVKANLGNKDVAPFAVLKVDEEAPRFDPRDRATTQFLLVAQPGAIDGFGVYQRAKEWKAGGPFPPGLASGNDLLGLQKAFEGLLFWVDSTFGSISDKATDPVNWVPRRLEYDLRLKAGDAAQASLTAVPDREGLLSWPCFDFAGPTGVDPFTNPDNTEVVTEIPKHVRFRGMPAPRFWDFESNELAFSDVNVDTIELAKLILLDVAIVYGIDWFTVPVEFRVGKIAGIKTLVVRDVFGVETTIERADGGVPPNRWSLFTPSRGAELAKFTVLPPSAGRTAQQGPVLEEVRFARDEAANFVWAIERVTTTPIGRPRTGNERDAAVDAAEPPQAPSGDTTAPLRYQLESKIPVNWIPFLGVRVAQPPDPKIELEKAAVARPSLDANEPRVALVPSTAKILAPDKITGNDVYRLPEEEVPRAGLRVQRVVYRSRWVDGSTHVWVVRRKLVGAGETQSGLRFDAALPTQK
jgi:hypothetical protein